MFYRLYCLFNVSKRRAAVIAILCAIVGFAMLPLGSDFASVTAGMFVWGMIYGCIWFYKFHRDKNIVAKAKLEVEQEPAQLTVEMTSPGSSHLFVPKQLDNR